MHTKANPLIFCPPKKKVNSKNKKYPQFANVALQVLRPDIAREWSPSFIDDDGSVEGLQIRFLGFVFDEKVVGID